MAHALATTRRRLVGDGASVLAASAALSAFPSYTVRRLAQRGAQPTPAQTAITLIFQSPWTLAWDTTATVMNNSFFADHFTSQHRGVRVNAQWHAPSWASMTTQNAQMAASVSGTEGQFPDVIETGEAAAGVVAWVDSGLLTPLDAYIRRDNLDLAAAFGQSAVAAVSYDGATLGLPAYTSPAVLYYRQDVLQQMGLSYPDPEWDWKTAERFWTECVAVQKATGFRAGLSISDSAAFAQINWMLRAWGAVEMDGSRTRAMLDSGPAVSMATFVQNAFTNHSMIGWSFPVPCLQQEQAVFNQNGAWALPQLVEGLGINVAWDILPVPYWPAGRSTDGETNFYALNKATRYPEAAWELMRYVALAPDYQRFLMRLTLSTPGLVSLWPEWEAAVIATAPRLRGKSLGWFQDAAVRGYAWGPAFFKYDTAQADNLINTWFPKIEANKVSAGVGLRQLAYQLDALEKPVAAKP